MLSTLLNSIEVIITHTYLCTVCTAVQPFDIVPGTVPYVLFKENQNAPRPSEHPPLRGGEMSKRLGGIKGCKYKTSSWHLNGFPDGNNIGSTV